MSRNKLAVLGLLYEQSMHGYQIVQEIKRRSMDLWAKISMASIYDTLIKLQNKSFINVKKEQVGKMPQRNVYSITDKGKKELTKLILDGLAKSDRLNNVVFLLSVAFMKAVPKNHVHVHLTKRKKFLEETIDYVRDLHKTHKEVIPFNWLYIIDTSLEHLLTELKSIKLLLKKIQNERWEKT